MDQKNIIIIALVGVVLVCLAIIAGMILFQNNADEENNTTNDTVNITLNDSDNQTNSTSTQATKSKSSDKKSSSDDIPSEGTYKGVEYSLHQGEYPYYSPQNEKTYYSKKEEYNDMKDAIDSGIAD